MTATVIVACLVPDFTDFMNLVSSLSSTFTSFVFPCFFHAVIFWKDVKQKWWLLLLDVGIVVVALTAGFFGAIFAIVSLSCDLFDYTLIASLPCESS